MSKNITVISSSLRYKSNSEILCEEFIKGAKEAGHSVNKISIKNLDLKFCIGCLKCLDLGKCVLNDGINEILSMMQNSDVLVFATPIYYYSVCGQLKTFLDRMNPLFAKNNRFKEVYLFTAAAENSDTVFDGAVNAVQGWIDCFDGVRLAGTINAVGVNEEDEAKGTSFANEAYNLGKSIN